MLTRHIKRSMSPLEHTVSLSGIGTICGEVWTVENASAQVVRFLNVPHRQSES